MISELKVKGLIFYWLYGIYEKGSQGLILDTIILLLVFDSKLHVIIVVTLDRVCNNDFCYLYDFTMILLGVFWDRIDI